MGKMKPQKTGFWYVTLNNSYSSRYHQRNAAIVRSKYTLLENRHLKIDRWKTTFVLVCWFQGGYILLVYGRRR